MEIDPTKVVEPGSKSDPFSVNYDPTSEATAVSPTPVIPSGVARANTADGPQAQAAVAATASEATAATPQAASPAATPAETAQKSVTDIEALIKESVGKAVRGVQSASDKRIAALEKELAAAREAAIKAERDAKLNSDDLTDEEKDLLREKYKLDDEKAKLKADIDANMKYHRELQVARLASEYSKYGVTADDLDAIDDPDEMESFAKDKALEFFQSGKSLQAAIAQTPVVTPQAVATTPVETAPAGATAPSHVGGDAPAAKPPEFLKGSDKNSFYANFSNLPTETIKFN